MYVRHGWVGLEGFSSGKEIQFLQVQMVSAREYYVHERPDCWREGRRRFAAGGVSSYDRLRRAGRGAVRGAAEASRRNRGRGALQDHRAPAARPMQAMAPRGTPPPIPSRETRPGRSPRSACRNDHYVLTSLLLSNTIVSSLSRGEARHFSPWLSASSAALLLLSTYCA